jgi:hypothetical protein
MASDSSSSTMNTASNAETDINLERKRARDRKSQRAMRDRTKWNIEYLTAQVQQLSRALEIETRARSDLYTRFLALGEENDHLRVQKAALQLRLLGENNGHIESVEAGGSRAVDPSLEDMHPHEATPLNTNPTCLSDKIIQSFIERWRETYMLRASQGPDPASMATKLYPEKSDLSALFDGRPNRSIDDTAAVVGDIVRSYLEIDTLPKQVAVHYIMSTLMKVRSQICRSHRVGYGMR